MGTKTRFANLTKTVPFECRASIRIASLSDRGYRRGEGNQNAILRAAASKPHSIREKGEGAMSNTRGLLLALVITVVAFSSATFVSKVVYAADNGVLLTGTVKAASGEKMGRVTVSAKPEGRTITTSVFTDEEGVYYFPALEQGRYQL